MTFILAAILFARLPVFLPPEPATKVLVRIEGAAVERYFVALDDEYLTVLNLSMPTLPKRQLLGMAVDHPDWMAATWKTIYKDDALRVGPEGVFIKDRKLADLAQVVERIPRAKLTSLTKR